MEKTITTEQAARIFRMISVDGFIAIFWEEIRCCVKSNTQITHREVFDRLNDEYYNHTNVYRYSSYESFKQLLHKK